MGNPVVRFEINSQNPAALHEFYGRLFDWNIHVLPDTDYGSVDTEDGGIGGGIGPADGPNQVTFYIEVDDLQGTLTRVELAGGKTVVPVIEVPGVVTFAQFADPDGNVVGLVKSEPEG